MTKPSFLALCLAAAFAPAQALTLDFGNGPLAPDICTSVNTGLGDVTTCGNGGFIGQGYGDIAGVLDVRYDAPRFIGDRTLRWWAADYNSLYGVLWADGSDSDSQAAIDLAPLNGATVTLNSFDLGAYADTTRGTNVTVSDLATGAVLYSFSGTVGVFPGNLPTSFAFNDVSSANGLRISWRDSAYNVGIDNIDFTLTAVPEPGTWALLAAGLLAVGGVARRRAG